eukprot:c30460_g1_i1 orf=1-333(-)
MAAVSATAAIAGRRQGKTMEMKAMHGEGNLLSELERNREHNLLSVAPFVGEQPEQKEQRIVESRAGSDQGINGSIQQTSTIGSRAGYGHSTKVLPPRSVISFSTIGKILLS